MVALVEATVPPLSPGATRNQAGVERMIQRGGILVIGLYLVVALVLPMAMMLARSLDHYRLDLTTIEVEADGGTGWAALGTVAEVAPERAIADLAGRPLTALTSLSGRTIFREVELPEGARVRLRDLSGESSRLTVENRPVPTGEWAEVALADASRLAIATTASLSLGNYIDYLGNPSLSASIWNSLTVSLISTVLCVGLAFMFAYSLSRSRMRAKGLFRGIALIPLLAPSLLPAIALVYLFGNQGIFRDWLLGHSIYGPIGIVIGEVFWTFPHALLILTTALSAADGRLYEAATALCASPWRVFWTVTLPGARYGLISAMFVVFTLVFTDFGTPKVIGGQYNVLATDIYKQVIGQQNFEMGAVISMVLLIPAVLAFVVDRMVQRRQVALLSSRAVPYHPPVRPAVDWGLFVACGLVAVAIVGVLAMATVASLVKLWPYNLELTLDHYDFRFADGGGWDSYANSLQMAFWTASIGTIVIFTGAYLIEKTRGLGRLRGGIQFLTMLPLAVPGLVLGLSYIFFFNAPGNPLGFVYGGMAILVISTITHFYTVSHLTAVTALKQIDPEFESVSASLKVPFWRTFFRVTVPLCLPAILGIAMYLFLNAMTTVSAVVFLYSPSTTLASVAVLNMDDAGDTAAAAAMAMLIVATSAGIRLIYAVATRRMTRGGARWRS